MPTTDYTATVAWLYALEAARGMDFKLERVALALKNLGNPQTLYPCIHVAGTNGKGSVCAMTHAVLGAAGYRTGLYVSPHLVSFLERIRVGTNLISESEVVDLVGRIRTAATVRGIDLTFFELVTVMAFLHFADQAVDVAVIEVGLGGRLDATNVIEPLVSVITSIDLDHEDYLGTSIESVASEKCGIIKRGVPVVVGRVDGEADKVIRSVVRSRQAPSWRANEDFFLSGASDATFSGLGYRLDGISLALRGHVQIENAAVAIATIRLVADALPVDDDALRLGLARVEWPGRLEVFPGEPMVIADAAHNGAAIRRLTAELPAIVGARKIHLLFAVMRDKRWEPMLKELIPNVTTVTLTTVLPGRGESPSRLAEAIGHAGVPVNENGEAEAAFEALLASAGEGEAILITGSLFLVGKLYPALSRRRLQLHSHASLG